MFKKYKLKKKMVNVFQSLRTLDGINQIKILPYSINGTLGGLFIKYQLKYPYI